MTTLKQPISKALRQDLMNRASVLGIGLVHIYNPENPRGGLTVAFRPVAGYKSTRMVTCAVNVCSIEDMFDKKIGAPAAIQKFLFGECIDLPLLNMFAIEDVAYAVKRGFSSMYEATTAL